MARLILDTSIIVDSERGSDVLESFIEPHDDVAVAAISIAELELGVRVARPRTRESRRRLVDAVTRVVRIVPYDAGVAYVHARLMAEARAEGRPRGAHDLIIAATAAATDRVLLTADGRAFGDLDGVRVRLA